MGSTIVDPTSAGKDGFVTENPQGSGKKYLTLHVPNFSQNMHSYLCLGSSVEWFGDANPGGAAADPSIHGQKLANLVVGFCDDDRAQDYRNGLAPDGMGGTSDAPPPPQETVDDVGQSIPPSPPATDTTPAGPFPATSGTPPTPQPTLMQNESAILQQKGGWRDHSDGNRITTTFGDKVEVVRGNYKLLVLGRQDDPSQQVAGWDVSGGLVSDAPADLNYPPPDTSVTGLFPPFPQPRYGGQQALSTQYTWQQDSDGNWGWSQVTQTGSYVPPPTQLANPATNQGAGTVTNYTWVDDLSSFWGSGAPGTEENAPNPLKRSISKEWAETIVVETHAIQKTPIVPYSDAAPSLTTTTTSDGTMTTNIISGGQMITNTVAVGGTVPAVSLVVPDPSQAMITNVTAGVVPQSVLTWPTITPTPDADGIPMLVSPGMNLVTASQGQLNSRLHSEGDMVTETSTAGAMNVIVASGTVAGDGIIPGLPTFLPQHIDSTSPGSMNVTTAAQGYMQNTLFSALDLTNTVQSSGGITNQAQASTNLYNHQQSATQEDMVLTGFHIMLEISTLLLDVKPMAHADIHNVHLDCHINHLDFHLGAHVTIDAFSTVKLYDAGDNHAAPWFMFL